VTRDIALIGAPSSAGAFAPGQEEAPGALRAAGLVQALEGAGLAVRDLGDTPAWRWRPDPERPRAMHVAQVARTARAVAEKVEQALDARALPLVLGGDCTVELGTVLGVRSRFADARLLYFDPHPDLNVPDGVPDGALDWMGVAHLLGVEGAVPELTSLGGTPPALAPVDLLLYGCSADRTTAGERAAIAELELAPIMEAEVAGDPAGSAARALARLDGAPYVVHFDVDAVDFASMPLAENTDRNVGLAFATAMDALAGVLAGERLTALTVSELNPHHGAADGSTLRAFVERLATALGAAGR
jgi:arginase